ncbi:MAG TPA: hypothetical protein ENJ53_10845 [Phaeodactylibacter sp.]|nr:hypothetical protein [Phaeodactylibacter sp.]
MKKKILFSFLVLFFIQSCQTFFKEKQKDIFYYFFIGHCYQWDAPDWGRVDYRLGKIRLDTFDQIWLGGDLVANMFYHPHNIELVDSLFKVGEPTTHWAVGNHDVLDQQADYSKIEAKTHRKTYSTSFFNGITLLVLNTTEFGYPLYYGTPRECEILDGQMDLIKAVTDTIQNSSHLVILHHHSLLTNELTDGKVDMRKIFNYYNPSLNIGCKVRGTFSGLVYPLLMKVQERGVQVVVVGGDTGELVKEFEFTTEEGIVFLGAGLNNSAGTKNRPASFDQSPDKVLIFKHQPKLRKLEWEFRELKIEN